MPPDDPITRLIVVAREAIAAMGYPSADQSRLTQLSVVLDAACTAAEQARDETPLSGGTLRPDAEAIAAAIVEKLILSFSVVQPPAGVYMTHAGRVWLEREIATALRSEFPR